MTPRAIVSGSVELVDSCLESVAINAAAFTDVQRQPLRGPKQPPGTRFRQKEGKDGIGLKRFSMSCATIASKSVRTRAKGMPCGCRPACHTAPVGGGTD